MHQHAISRLIALRQTLKENASTCAEEVIHQINEIMFMLLKQEVFIDFMSAVAHEHVVLSKLIALTKHAEEMSDSATRDVLCEELHCIMSACLSGTLLGSSHAPLPCNGLSAQDRLQCVRSSLAQSL